jgi:2-polyprenyl-6-methoxyphenol hydroxylase-like FAD-dependent oxidoreductase
MAGRRRVLISGLGIAGSTLAWWLAEFGFDVEVVERASVSRTGGYMIDFWGLGYEVAERMGIVEDLRARAYLVDQLRLERADGEILTTIGAKAIRATMGERFISIMRGDLASVIQRQLGDRAEIRFNESICRVVEREGRVEVGFRRGAEARFDLVIGADGVHSRVRELVGPPRCEYSLGYWTASFSTSGYRHRNPGAYVSFTGLGRQVARYALRDDRTAFFFIFRAPKDRPTPRTPEDQKAVLTAHFGNAWECKEIFESLDGAEDLYFDSVSQVRAPRWSSGRVGLVGDAAYCPSLLAGEGACFAMAGAYVLAGELHRRGADDPSDAFNTYESLLRPLIERKQRGALRLGGWFAPRTRLGLSIRNGLNRLAAIPAFAPLLFGDMLSTDLELPAYGRGGRGDAVPSKQLPTVRRAF